MAKRAWIAHPRKVARKGDRSDPVARQSWRDDAREERWALRRGYRRLTKIKRVEACGRPGLRSDGSVLLRVTDARGTSAQASTGATGRVAGFGGLFHCGNVHVCLDCAAKISATRAEEVQRVLTHYIAAGGWAVLVTLTMRHWLDHSLRQCLKGFSAGWQAANSGADWHEQKLASRYAGYCRALEVNDGPNGWHAHAHAILVFHTRPSEDMINAIAGGMFDRWSRALVRTGLPAPDLEHGLDVQHPQTNSDDATLFETTRTWAQYVAKGIAAEATLGIGKSAKGKNRSVRELMRDALIPETWEDPDSGALVHTVDLRARARLAEYEEAMRGRKALTWSQNDYDLRAGAGLEEERSEEDIAQDDLQGQDVAVIPSESWRIVEPRATDLLSVTERDGPAGAYRWLDALGVTWWHATGLSDQRRYGEPPGVT